MYRVAFNAGPHLLPAATAATLREGTDLAREALFGGRAGAVLDAYIEASNG
jgi:anthranilate phosphoribosyltransferase